MAQPLIAGNAIRLFLTPPDGAQYWRVLKKGSDDISGPTDVGSLVAYEGDDRVFVDADVASLPNDQAVFYKPFYRMAGDTWQPAASVSATPSATYQDASVDFMSFVRERIEAGMKVECDRGNFQTELGYIQVYTAPPSLEQSLRFPCVTISVEGDDPAERGIGEDIFGEEFDAVESEFYDTEGWLANSRLSITAWSLNSDERVELRKALRRIIVANLPILSSKGFDQVSLSMSDTDAVNGEFEAPIYQVMATLTCLAPVRVGRPYGADEVINSVEVTANG